MPPDSATEKDVIATYLSMSVGELYEALGATTLAIEADYSIAEDVTFAASPGLAESRADGFPAASPALAESRADGFLARAGKQIFESVREEAFDLVCGDSDTYKKEREAISIAITTGSQAAVMAVITAGLTAAGITAGAAIAVVVAAIIVKLFWSTVRNGVCALWKEDQALPDPA
jgi:hypothetical protein